MNTSLLFAQAYGAGNYSSINYQDTSSQTGTTTSSTTGSALSNTGFDILLVGTLACALIFAALVIRFWKRPKAIQK